jgi:hypothetical protein
VAHPFGLPQRSGTLLDKVTAANALYSWTSAVVAKAFSLGIMTSVENPWRSYFWLIDEWNSHTKFLPHFDTYFDHCMYSSSRRKHTRLWHTVPALQNLSIECDDLHDHAKWGWASGGWATAAETAYPIALCKAWAYEIHDQLVSFGAVDVPLALTEVDDSNNPRLSQTYLTKQPRRKSIPALVKEFKQVVTLSGPQCDMPPVRIESLDAWPIPATISVEPTLDSLPHGSRTVRTLFNTGEGKDDAPVHIDMLNSSLDCSKFTSSGGPNKSCRRIVGIPWTPEEFLKQAISCKHPRNIVHGLPKELVDSIVYNVVNSDEHIASERTQTIRHWLGKAIELMELERDVKDSAPQHCKRILASKRIKLFEFLLQEAGHDDKDLCNNIVRGFDLAGDIPDSNVFRKRQKFSTLTVDDLRGNAARIRSGILGTLGASPDPEIDEGVYAATLEELNSGWLFGPCEPSTLPQNCSVTRRFGVKQGNKIRPIDDFSESMVNSTTSATETITLHSVEIIGTMIVKWFEVCRDHDCRVDLRIKCWDLQKAYK